MVQLLVRSGPKTFSTFILYFRTSKIEATAIFFWAIL